MTTALQEMANRMIVKGWEITSMTDSQFIAKKRKGMNPVVGIIGIIGLLFYIIPGLLILLLGYVARGTETKIVTADHAEFDLAYEKKHAQEIAEAKAGEAAQMAERRAAFKAGHKVLGIFGYSWTSALAVMLLILFVLAFGAMLVYGAVG